jgi:hypothetical protein
VPGSQRKSTGAVRPEVKGKDMAVRATAACTASYSLATSIRLLSHPESLRGIIQRPGRPVERLCHQTLAHQLDVGQAQAANDRAAFSANPR